MQSATLRSVSVKMNPFTMRRKEKEKGTGARQVNQMRGGKEVFTVSDYDVAVVGVWFVAGWKLLLMLFGVSVAQENKRREREIKRKRVGEIEAH